MKLLKSLVHGNTGLAGAVGVVCPLVEGALIGESDEDGAGVLRVGESFWAM